jgi:hypothetical protein
MYITPRERTAIIMALGIGLSLIIATLAIAHSLNALVCPLQAFC